MSKIYVDCFKKQLSNWSSCPTLCVLDKFYVTLSAGELDNHL